MMAIVTTLQASHKQFPNLLELSARPWLYELGITKLSQVPDSVLDDFVKRGIDSIYLLGIWELGDFGLQHDRTDAGLLSGYKQILPDFTMDDVIGSCFAIVEYAPNSKEIGTEADIIDFRKRLNNRGIMLYLDFVPNHAAVDAKLVSSHPEYFVRSTYSDSSKQYNNGMYYGKDKYGNVWTDTLQFNYFNPATVASRIEDLMTVARLADGTRCDMAMLALNYEFEQIWGSIVYQQGYQKPSKEFWTRAISEVKAKYPNFKFMAEVYWNDGDTLISLGFDYVYDKEGLYDQLRSQYIDNIKNYISARGSKINVGTHFVENHDEGRAAVAYGSNQVANAAALVSFTLPGMRFHFDGQWVGRKNKLDVHLRRSYKPQSDVDASTQKFYDTFLPILKDDVWHTGTWKIQTPSGTNDCWRLMAWTWTKGTQTVLVVINYSDTQGTGQIKLPLASGTYKFVEKLTGVVYERDGNEVRNNGLFVIIEKWSAQIFYVEK